MQFRRIHLELVTSIAVGQVLMNLTELVTILIIQFIIILKNKVFKSQKTQNPLIKCLKMFSPCNFSWLSYHVIVPYSELHSMEHPKDGDWSQTPRALSKSKIFIIENSSR